MGAVVNIAGIGTGLERQHEGMGRAWELDVRGWEQMFGERVSAGCQGAKALLKFSIMGRYSEGSLNLTLTLTLILPTLLTLK